MLLSKNISSHLEGQKEQLIQHNSLFSLSTLPRLEAMYKASSRLFLFKDTMN